MPAFHPFLQGLGLQHSKTRDPRHFCPLPVSVPMSLHRSPKPTHGHVSPWSKRTDHGLGLASQQSQESHPPLPTTLKQLFSVFPVSHLLTDIRCIFLLLLSIISCLYFITQPQALQRIIRLYRPPAFHGERTTTLLEYYHSD